MPPDQWSETHARLIDRLFDPSDRAAAHAIARIGESNPQTAGRVESLLHEIAQRTDMPADQAYAYIADWMRSTGWPPGLVTGVLDRVTAPADAAREAAVMEELKADMTPQAMQAVAEADRAKAQEEMKHWESAMRSPQGSEAWNSYWRGDGAAKYADAVRRSVVEPPQLAPGQMPSVTPSAPARPTVAPQLDRDALAPVAPAGPASMAVSWKSVTVEPPAQD